MDTDSAFSTKHDSNALSNSFSSYERIRLEPIDRVGIMALLSTTAGGLCGGVLGGKLSGRQYLAERAHRLPTTVQGWFFYQKWKNYRVLLGAMKGAVRYGTKIGSCGLAYAAIEAGVDRLVGEVQAASSMAAGLATAVGVSVINKLPKSSARRACLAGLAVGLLTGVTQDMIHCKTDRPPAYITWALRRRDSLLNQ